MPDGAKHFTDLDSVLARERPMTDALLYTPSGPAPNAPKPQPRPERPWWKFWGFGGGEQ